MRIRKMKKIIILLIIMTMLQTQIVSLSNVAWAINMEMSGETTEGGLGTSATGTVEVEAEVTDEPTEEVLPGITASGARAASWYTIAAGSSYPMGTVIYIPYFASQPNGAWFVVEDRGGAITNARLDIYMDTLVECTNFGRRNLECYVYY